MPIDAATGALLSDAARRIRNSPATGVAAMWAARVDAENLLDLATGDARAAAPTVAQRRRFAALVDRRVDGEPMALLAGHVDFMGLRIGVRPGVFAPRESTGMLVMAAVARLRRRTSPVMIDVATGAGPIALAVARSVPHARVIGTDIAADAVAVARANARRLGLANAGFRRGDLLGGVPSELRGSVDVLTLHPPYVPAGDLSLLPTEVSKYEPRHTLTDGSSDGMELARRLAAVSAEWLVPGGWLLLEVSPDRARLAMAAMTPHLEMVRRMGARGDVTRVIAGRRPAERRAGGPRAATQGAASTRARRPGAGPAGGETPGAAATRGRSSGAGRSGAGPARGERTATKPTPRRSSGAAPSRATRS